MGEFLFLVKPADELVKVQPKEKFLIDLEGINHGR